jgi:carbamoyltransferase
MNRLYIGIACTIHDPAVAVVNEQGQLIYAQSAERSLQSKRGWFAVPVSKGFIDRVVAPNLTRDSQIVVASSWRLDGDMSPLLACLTQPERLQSMDAFPAVVLGTLATRANAYIQLRDHLRLAMAAAGSEQIAAPHLRCFDHHLTHAATACYSSPYAEAVCAVIDGWGEGTATAFFRWADGRLTPISTGHAATARAESSLGFFYAYLCNACGFDASAGEEWKVMGLAAYGRYDARIHQLLSPLLEVHDLQLRLGCDNAFQVWAQVHRYLGDARSPRDCADLAYTGQMLFEETCATLLRNLRTRGISDNLVLCGGCALNSSWNGKVIPATGFSSLFVPSAPADDGNAAGAAWLAFREDHPEWKHAARVQTPYLGDELQEWALRSAIEHGGLRPVALNGRSVARHAAELIASGKIIAWVQGRAEFGPRALGNRSILADPRNPDIKRLINSRVKFREEFRPFAPSVLQERAEEYFENYQDSPYMDRTLPFRAEVRRRVPGVVHEDGTGRLQTVRRDTNPRFHELIVEFDALTGVPLVLNTSLNVMGKPIVHSVEDAIAVFMTTGLDALVIGETIFEKAA